MAELNQKVHEVLTRSVSAIFPSREALEKILLSGKRLRIYLGVDPTGLHLHLGQLTNLLVLKKFQELGHEIIFLIGDFTARVGDPSGKLATRRALTKEEVTKNMRTFKEQVARIISFSGKNPVKIRKNSEWYEEMGLGKFMKNISGYFTVNNMLNRDMFKERIKKVSEEGREGLDSINLNELMYPLLQGYDGWELGKDIGGVDVEVGGNDQIFNMNIGRKLRWALNVHTKDSFFIATKLLEHPKTGEKLMSKSEGGMINLDDTPEDIFGKVMALDDVSMFPVAEFCTEMLLENVEKLRKLNPRDAKLDIAEAVVKTIYGEKAAATAREKFIEVFSKKEMPADLPTLKLTGKGLTVIGVVMATGLAKSKGEARRLAEQGAVEIDDIVKKDANEILSFHGGEVIKIGKRHFFRVRT